MNQNFSALVIKQAYLNASKLFHSSSNNFANHYDTLKLQRNCTSQQIRDSFIQLSKKIHPDLNKSPNAHKNFLKVQEAYNVLSKPHLRASYDLELAHPGYRSESGRQWRYGPVYRDPWDDPSFYRNRKTYQEYKSGMPRPKSGFLAMCVVAAVAMAFTVEILVVYVVEATGVRAEKNRRYSKDPE
uniref:J domain-containing protein n=1 Tax=Dendroctonus ponderosae TaxID=77166 RepID=A0AAR5Q2I9_DENPD